MTISSSTMIFYCEFVCYTPMLLVETKIARILLMWLSRCATEPYDDQKRPLAPSSSSRMYAFSFSIPQATTTTSRCGLHRSAVDLREQWISSDVFVLSTLSLPLENKIRPRHSLIFFKPYFHTLRGINNTLLISHYRYLHKISNGTERLIVFS